MSVCLTNQREERILLRSAPSRTNHGISCLEDLEVLTSTALYASSRMESWFNWLQPCRIKQNVVSIAGSSFLSVLASDLEVLAAFRPKKGSSSRHTSRIFSLDNTRGFRSSGLFKHAQPPAGASRRPTTENCTKVSAWGGWNLQGPAPG